MNEVLVLTILVVSTALIFDFVNGFHDASNSIATIVATGVLKPLHAVVWASFFNFAALFFFGTAVAHTVGNGMIDLDTVTPLVILAGLVGAICWGLMTWWMRLPTSSSHALIGGYAGAAIFNTTIQKGFNAFWSPIIVSGWTKTLIFIVVSPLIGITIAQVLMRMTMALQKCLPKNTADRLFGQLQFFSSAFLSLMHGSNDAQKTAGIIAGTLLAAGYYEEFTIPMWVLWASYGTMGLGTLAGGWRIVQTLGFKLTRLRPNGGFSAETSAALAIFTATTIGLPVSTTQATTGAVIGVGAARNLKAVRWNVAGNILWAWILTIPCAGALGAIAMGAVLLCTGLK